ncbi:MAG: GTP-binding protein [Candidatus Hodarchaeales archaeon]|jgi:elongation factor 1-alpha
MHQNEEQKPTISFVTLGHIDHGKSTSLGHFLYKIGAIDKRQIDKLDAESKELNRASWKWAYVLDSTDEERQGGITADIAFQPFQTKTGKKFMLIDGPGHRDFVKNAIKGAVQTDACILMVSAIPNDLRAGLKQGKSGDPGGQTREHAILGSVLGIQSIIICINKMDSVNYSEEAFNNAVDSIKGLLKDIQSPWLKSLTEESYIPISGMKGDNLVEKSSNLSWYKGLTLLEALEEISALERKTAPEDLRFLVFDSYDFPGVGNMLYGRLIAGSLINEQEIRILPSGETGSVKDIWNIHSESIQDLKAGEFGSLQIKGIERDRLLPGTLISSVNSQLKPAQSILCRVLILESASRPLVPGSSVIVHVGLLHAAAVIEQIVKIEKEKKQRKTQKIMLAYPGELALLEIKPDIPIIVEKFSEQPILGRLILRHSGQTIAVGIVTELKN